MAYTRKTWVNVPDPDNYSGDIPLSDLPRYDAQNMNRIEGGIEDAHLHIANKSNPHDTTAAQVGAVAIGDDIVIGSSDQHSVDGGLRIGFSYTEVGVPYVGVGTERGSNSIILATGCDHTNEAKENELGARCYYYPVEFSDKVATFPAALKLSNNNGGLYLLNSKDGLKKYSKNDILTMQEYEVLHTGNFSKYTNTRIATGNYVGTGGGAYGADNALTLSFDFDPQIVWVYGTPSSQYGFTLYRNLKISRPFSDYTDWHNCTVIWKEKYVSWYYPGNYYDKSDRDNATMNASGQIYNYVAIG